MSLKSKAAKGVFWSVVESWGRQLFSSATFFILARLLGPESFGLIALAGVYIAFLTIFTGGSLSAAVVQRKDIDPEHLDTAFWIGLGIGCVLTLISFVAAPFIAKSFDEPALSLVIRVLSLNFLIGPFSSVQMAIFKRKLDFRMISIRTLVATFASGLVGVGMALSGFGIWSLVGQQLTNSVCQFAVLWWVSDWRPGLRVSKRHFDELFAFSIHITGFSFVNFFSRRSDDLLIGYFLGPVALGYYNVAYKLLLTVIDLLSRVIEKVAMPTFSRLQREPERMRAAFYQVTQLTSLVSFPVFAAMGILSPELIRVIFGEQWESSIPVMQILVFIGILQSSSIFNSTILLSLGKSNLRLKLGILNSISSVLCFLAAVRFGIVAVAAAYVVRGYLLAPIPVFVIRRAIKLKILNYLAQFLPALLGSLLMALIMITAKNLVSYSLNETLLLLLISLLGGGVYILFLTLIFPARLMEVKSLLKLATSKTK
ncbi:flippase [filamentous cyanobacterium CCP5]|nr:flippase [filamentous cyanobacterium CCP5]